MRVHEMRQGTQKATGRGILRICATRVHGAGGRFGLALVASDSVQLGAAGWLLNWGARPLRSGTGKPVLNRDLGIALTKAARTRVAWNSIG